MANYSVFRIEELSTINYRYIAVGIALLARLEKSFQDYVLRLVVQKICMQVFNDGLKQTLRLSFQEYEDQRSGKTLAVLQKDRIDTECFIN